MLFEYVGLYQIYWPKLNKISMKRVKTYDTWKNKMRDFKLLKS